MQSLLALVLRGAVAIMGALVFWSGVWGVPQWIADRAAFFDALNTEWRIRVLALLCGTLLGLVALGPARLQSWKRVVSDWYYADARKIGRLQAENEELRKQIGLAAQQTDPSGGEDSAAARDSSRRFDAELRQKFLNRYMDKAEALEAENTELQVELDRQRSRVVARIENLGPVSIPEDEPYIIDPPKYRDYGWPIICVAPYNDHDVATTVEIENPESEHDIVVSYEVQSVTDEFSAAFYTMSLEARVWVMDGGGKRVKNLDFYRGTIDVSQDGSWEHAISGRCTFVGLPKGIYGLKIVDYTAMDGYRGHPRREYRHMRLRVVKGRD